MRKRKFIDLFWRQINVSLLQETTGKRTKRAQKKRLKINGKRTTDMQVVECVFVIVDLDQLDNLDRLDRDVGQK